MDKKALRKIVLFSSVYHGTKREKAWILGNITVSKAMQRDIRYRIRRKLDILCSEELPLLKNKGFLRHEANISCQPGRFVFNTDACSIVANDDGVVPNGDGSSAGRGTLARYILS